MINTYNILVAPLEEKVKLYKDTNADTVKNSLIVRGSCLGLVPLTLMTSGLDTATGTLAGALNMLTLGKNTKVYLCMSEQLTSTHGVATRTYKLMMMVVNPDAEFSKEEELSKKVRFKKPSSRIAAKSYGLFTKPQSKLRQKAGEWEGEKSFFKSKVASKVLHVADGSCRVFTRSAEGLVGGAAGVLSLALHGEFPELNGLASRGLQAPGLLKDFFITQTLVTAGTTTMMHHSNASNLGKSLSKRELMPSTKR